MTLIERAAMAAREEIVRQYREDERGKCPAGVNYYEEHIAPDLIARAVLEAIREPSEEMKNVGVVTSRRCVNQVDGEALISGTIGETVWTAMIDAALGEGV